MDITMPYDNESKNQFITAITQMSPQEIADFFAEHSKDELIAAVTELVAFEKNNSNLFVNMSTELKKTKSEVAGVKRELSDVKKRLEDVELKYNALEKKLEKTDAFLQDLYNSRTIEQSLDSLARLGVFAMQAEQCQAYYLDYAENKLFTIGEDNERIYIDIDDNNSYITQVFASKHPLINNEYFDEPIGDNQSIAGVKNVAVIPIVSKSDDTIGVIVAKNKENGFNELDSKAFDPKENGSIGSNVCANLENNALLQISFTDELTRLVNRNGASVYLKDTVLPAVKEGKSFTTILLDIDDFKKVNDTYGHDKGDEALKLVSSILKENTRAVDGVFRWGGEELVVIAHDMNEHEGYTLADRLRKTISETPLHLEDGGIKQLTVSVGVSEIRPFDYARTSKSEVKNQFDNTTFKEADRYLYDAKHNGKNQVCASKSVMDKAKQKLDNEKSTVEVKTFECKKDIDFLHRKDCMLIEPNSSIAEMNLTSTSKDGKAIDIHLEVTIGGQTEIRYLDEWHTKASEFPEALHRAISYGDYSKFDIISSTHYTCHHSAMSDGKVIAEGEVLWNKRTLDSQTPEDLRNSLVGHAEHLMYAIEHKMELTERSATPKTDNNTRTAEEKKPSEPKHNKQLDRED